MTGAERYDSQRADVRFRLPDGEETIIAGLTIPQVARPTPIVNWDELKQRWPHLADVPVIKSGGKIDVLLGLDHAQALAVSKASLTALELKKLAPGAGVLKFFIPCRLAEQK